MCVFELHWILDCIRLMPMFCCQVECHVIWQVSDWSETVAWYDTCEVKWHSYISNQGQYQIFAESFLLFRYLYNRKIPWKLVIYLSIPVVHGGKTRRLLPPVKWDKSGVGHVIHGAAWKWFCHNVNARSWIRRWRTTSRSGNYPRLTHLFLIFWKHVIYWSKNQPQIQSITKFVECFATKDQAPLPTAFYTTVDLSLLRALRWRTLQQGIS